MATKTSSKSKASEPPDGNASATRAKALDDLTNTLKEARSKAVEARAQQR